MEQSGCGRVYGFLVLAVGVCSSRGDVEADVEGETAGSGASKE